MLMDSNANEPRPKTRPPQTPPPPPRTLKPFTQSERAGPRESQSERAGPRESQSERAGPRESHSERAGPRESHSERSLSGLLRLCTSASCTSSIDNRIEQALDLVKTHLRIAVRDEVQVLRETIRDLQTQNQLLEQENRILRTITHTY